MAENDHGFTQCLQENIRIPSLIRPLKFVPTHSQLPYHISQNYSENSVRKYETNDTLKQYKSFVPLSHYQARF